MEADTARFRDLLSIPLRNGLTRPKRVRGSGTLMVNMGELFRHDRIGDIPMDRVPLHGTSPKNDLLEPGDLLFARQSLIASGAGKVSLFLGASEPVTFESHLIRARPDRGVADPRYLYYFFASPRGKALVQSIVNQVAAAGIRGSELSELRVPMRSLAEQHAISDVLETLDDKIESNRRVAACCDAAWLCHGRHALRGAGSRPVQELLDNGVLVINDGYRAKNSELAAEGIAFVRAGNLTDHGLELTGADRVPADLAARVGNKRSVTWDTAFTSKGTVGRITLVDPDAPAFVYSPQVCFWRSRDPGRLSPFVLHAWMRSTRFVAQIDAVKGQTDMADYVSLRDQRAMHLDLPEPAVQREVAEFAEPLARAASAARNEARTLTAIRAALLPKLVAGQIRVPLSEDLEEQVGAVTEALA